MKKMDGWGIPLGSLAFIVVSGWLYHNPIRSIEIKAFDAPAWVQAVGSIGAILIAVWVANHQYERARQDDRNETRAFVAAIYEEMQNIWQAYDGEVGPLLRAVQQQQFLNIIFPVGNDLFTIYNNASARVGKVEDAELRKLIVTVYAKSKGLVYSFLLNNQMVEDYSRYSASINGAVNNPQLLYKRGLLINYVFTLKIRDVEIQNTMAEFFKCAEDWLAGKR